MSSISQEACRQNCQKCPYPPGHTLTDRLLLSFVAQDWSVVSLLDAVARESYHTLIDTGALITGMTNRQVCNLPHLPASATFHDLR